MKSIQQITLRLPADLAARLSASTPPRKRNQFVVDLVRRELPERKVAEFSFRAVSPVFDIDTFSVNGKLVDDGRVQLWAANARGELCLQAEATLA